MRLPLSSVTASSLAIFALVACNFLIDTSSTQCVRDSDCDARFPGAALVCLGSSCVEKTPVVTDAGPEPDCKTNAECMDREAKVSGGPAICVKGPTPKCQPLRFEDVCVADVLPLDAMNDLRDDNVVLLAGFGPVKTNLLADDAVRAYHLALKEIRDFGGIPNGPNGALRPVVMMLCGSEEVLAERGIAHVTKDLKVPAIVARFSPKDIFRFVTSYAVANDVFTMNPNDTPASLKYQSVNQLAWHLLGTPEDLALTYAPLVKRIEEYVRTQNGGAAIKVALVTTDYPTDESIADTIEDGPTVRSLDAGLPRDRSAGAVSFNEKWTDENEALDNFKRVSMPSPDLGGSPDYPAKVKELADFRPDVIIASTGGRELENLVAPVERLLAQDGGAARLPVWALSVGNAHPPELMKYLASNEVESPTKKLARFVGVQYAGSTEPVHRDDWRGRMQKFFGADAGLADVATENNYDAIYWLAFGLYNAGPGAPPTAASIKDGIRKLLAGPRVFPGSPEVLAESFRLMVPGSESTFIGALGPRDIDRGTGTQFGYGGVYCYHQAASEILVNYDARRYDRTTKDLAFTKPGATEYDWAPCALGLR